MPFTFHDISFINFFPKDINSYWTDEYHGFRT